MSATKRLKSKAREADKCVFHMAEGNPNQLDSAKQYVNEILENMGMCRQAKHCLEEVMLEGAISSPASSQDTVVESSWSDLRHEQKPSGTFEKFGCDNTEHK